MESPLWAKDGDPMTIHEYSPYNKQTKSEPIWTNVVDAVRIYTLWWPKPDLNRRHTDFQSVATTN